MIRMKFGLMQYLGAALSMDPTIRNITTKNKVTPNEIDITPKVVIPKGCKVYNYPCFSCIASSQKAADKKYQRYLGLNIPQSIH